MSEAEIVRPFEDLEDAPHPSESQSCSGCLFYEKMDGRGRGMGRCRRYPPNLETIPDEGEHDTPNVSYPRVFGDFWCGEWADKNRKPGPVPWPNLDRYRKG